jgi:hypothetical protein
MVTNITPFYVTCSPNQKKRRSLAEELLAESAIEKKNDSCMHCPLRYKTKQSLNQMPIKTHMYTGAHACTNCAMVFSCRSKSARHATVHKKKLHKCEQCRFLTIKKSFLDAHVLENHPDIYFDCEHCDSIFQTRTELDMHTALHMKKPRMDVKNLIQYEKFNTLVFAVAVLLDPAPIQL